MQWITMQGSKDVTAPPLERARHVLQIGQGKSRDYKLEGWCGRWHVRPTDWLSTRRAKTYEVQERTHYEPDLARHDIGPAVRFDTQDLANAWVLAEHDRRVQEQLPEILKALIAEATERWEKLEQRQTQVETELFALKVALNESQMPSSAK